MYAHPCKEVRIGIIQSEIVTSYLQDHRLGRFQP
jgi:hypothetical protein